MRQLSSDLREFIGLLNTKQVKYVIVGLNLVCHGQASCPWHPLPVCTVLTWTQQ